MSNDNIIPKVTVVDSIMGSGKTTAAINMINNSSDDVHYLYITPYLDEVERIIQSCPKKKFKQPKFIRGSKLQNIKDLINKGHNIVSTHSLFKKFNKETIELAYINNYVLIMDEVAEVVEVYTEEIKDGENKRLIAREDICTILEKYAYVDEESHLLRWTDQSYPDNGVFGNIKRMAQLDSLTLYGDQMILWLFPVATFKAFKHIYILTYLFDSQIQKYYYDLFNIEYEKLSAGIINGKYGFTEYINNHNVCNINYDKLINIVESEKLNSIGDFDYSLSKNWYKNASKETLKKLKNNIYNFFYNVTKTKTENNLWTTFKKFKPIISGKGYTRGFAPLNSRATNQYKDRNAVAYPVNRFLDPNVRNYFVSHGIDVNEDEYALSEMLQFIWRSSIRDEKPITIYIPSNRMRILLKMWIYNMCKQI